VRVGDPTSFAIEWQLRVRADSFQFCGFRFWIAGHAVGDWGEDEVLGSLLHAAEVFHRYDGNRHFDGSRALHTSALIAVLEEITTSTDPGALQRSIEGRFRQRYLLHELAPVSVAPHFVVIAIDQEHGAQRVLCRDKDTNMSFDVVVPAHGVDTAVGRFIDANLPA
jgi:hypothetical protein